MTVYTQTAQVITDDKDFAGQVAAALTSNPHDVNIFDDQIVLDKNGSTAWGIDAICSINFAAAIDALNDETADETDPRFQGKLTAEQLAYARSVITADHYQCLIDGEYHNQPDAFPNLAAAHGFTIVRIGPEPDDV